ncbi:MAG: Fic family protein [Pseudomonadota bacterium]|nr:Fic family protein [Pseudomonadota bacterium]
MEYKPNESLALALKAAKDAAIDGVLEHTLIEPKQREILMRAGCLTQVIRGWYLLTKPEASGTSTVWYVGFWPFIRQYLMKRFGKQEYCLSADASLDLHSGECHVARQITVITKKTSNQTVELPEDTSLLLYTDTKNFPEDPVKLDGIYVMPMPLALCRLSPTYYKNKPFNVEIALKLIQSVSEISRILLKLGLVTDAGRIAGAFRAIGESQKADQIVRDMQAAGHSVTEENPFLNHTPVLTGRIKSAYAGRVEVMWKKMRETIIDIMPEPINVEVKKPDRVVRVIMDRYRQDAYHSLSIEGYEVTEDLIQQIAEGRWSPETNPKDREQIDTMAAKGYFEAFQKVIESVRATLSGINPGEIFERDLQDWYRALFSASVHAGILKPADLAGYRNGSVFIQNARHVPPRSKEAVIDSMETLFKLLKEEPHAGVKAILGHFIFVFIHPYSDGNGRIGRFLLNLMLVSGGYPWTVIRSDNRPQYMDALEAASTGGNIEPFARFVVSELKYWEKPQ